MLLSPFWVLRLFQMEQLRQSASKQQPMGFFFFCFCWTTLWIRQKSMDVTHLDFWFCKACSYHLPWQCGTPFKWDSYWDHNSFPEWFQFSKDTERLLKTSVQGQVIWPQWCTFSVVVLIIYALPGRVDLLHKLLPVLSLQWAPVWLSGCLTVTLWYSLSTVDLADGLLRLLLLRIYLCIHLFATPTAWPW